ncbi:MAG: dihydrolipoamide acetyltransferase family protein [Sulfuricaulis sp.]|nr:dihydrolipoamide acetyltransferase family protein [Sulfuricaulis sp.]
MNTATVLTEVRIPFMGSVENATILKWVAEIGSAIELNDALCEIETDKTVMEVESPSAGRLVKQLVEGGAELKVGALIAYLANTDATSEGISSALRALGLADEPAQAGTRMAVSDPGAAVAAGDARPIELATKLDGASVPARISPYARRLVKEHGLSLDDVSGNVPSGRVTGDDVLRHVANRKTASEEPARLASVASNADKEGTIESIQVATAITAGQTLPGYEGVPFTLIPHTSRRRAIARRLVEIARTAPHLTADVQVDLIRMLDSRVAFNERRTRNGQATVSVLAFFVSAACAALKAHPQLNATYSDEGLTVWKRINLGVAVDTPDGLVVPVIRDAGSLSVSEIAEAITAMSIRARDGKLRPEDMDGGTFTISNPGSIGPVLRAEAILNGPQVALLGFPAIQQTPIAVADAGGTLRVEIRPVMRPSLTFDHRALDGAAAVRYLTDFKNRLETMVFDW